jgi:predicted AAA+ superfamily ATPase
MEFKKLPFINRKKSIRLPKCLLYGPKFSGKSFLIYDHLCSLPKESYLYIDINQLGHDIQFLNKNLSTFCNEKNIKTLVLESYSPEVILPNVENIILTSSYAIDMSGFYTLELLPLDFEEFLAFDKGVDIVQSYNHFLQNGSFCEMFIYPNIAKQKRLLEMTKLLCINETEEHIIKLLCQYITFEVSTHQLFTLIKKSIKTSKDSTYKAIQRLKQTLCIYEVPHYAKSTKKFYLVDFALINANLHKKDFFKTFENAIFLELRKKHFACYYLNGIEFYLPNENKAILALAFATKEHKRLHHKNFLEECKKYGIKRVEIITVQNEFHFLKEDIEFEAIAFYTWAIGL